MHGPSVSEMIVLGLLYEQPGIHGAHLTELVDHKSEGRYKLPAGVVYPALKRLERKGHITGAWEDLAVAHREGHPARCFYRLTDSGLAALQDAVTMHKLMNNFLATALRDFYG